MVEEAGGDSGHGFLLDRWRAENPGVRPDTGLLDGGLPDGYRVGVARSKVLAEELYPQV
jgi:hypothetical protein